MSVWIDKALKEYEDTHGVTNGLISLKDTLSLISECGYTVARDTIIRHGTKRQFIANSGRGKEMYLLIRGLALFCADYFERIPEGFIRFTVAKSKYKVTKNYILENLENDFIYSGNNGILYCSEIELQNVLAIVEPNRRGRPKR
jgi:hypothetical protein